MVIGKSAVGALSVRRAADWLTGQNLICPHAACLEFHHNEVAHVKITLIYFSIMSSFQGDYGIIHNHDTIQT